MSTTQHISDQYHNVTDTSGADTFNLSRPDTRPWLFRAISTMLVQGTAYADRVIFGARGGDTSQGAANNSAVQDVFARLGAGNDTAEVNMNQGFGRVDDIVLNGGHGTDTLTIRDGSQTRNKASILEHFTRNADNSFTYTDRFGCTVTFAQFENISVNGQNLSLSEIEAAVVDGAAPARHQVR